MKRRNWKDLDVESLRKILAGLYSYMDGFYAHCAHESVHKGQESWEDPYGDVEKETERQICQLERLIAAKSRD